MKNTKTFLVMLLGLFAICAPASAQTPVEITQKLISAIKEKNSIEPAADVVDWDGALGEIDPADRKKMGLRSGEDLKKKEMKQTTGMGQVVEENLDNAIQNAPAARQPYLKEMQERAKAGHEKQRASSREAYIATSYTIGKATIEEKTATVAVTKKRGEKITEVQLDFKKVGRVWKLKSAAPLAAGDAPEAAANAKTAPPLGRPVVSPGEGIVRM